MWNGEAVSWYPFKIVNLLEYFQFLYRNIWLKAQVAKYMEGPYCFLQTGTT